MSNAIARGTAWIQAAAAVLPSCHERLCRIYTRRYADEQAPIEAADLADALIRERDRREAADDEGKPYR